MNNDITLEMLHDSISKFKKLLIFSMDMYSYNINNTHTFISNFDEILGINDVELIREELIKHFNVDVNDSDWIKQLMMKCSYNFYTSGIHNAK